MSVCAGLHQLRGDVRKPTVKLVRYLEHADGKLATSGHRETHKEVVDDVQPRLRDLWQPTKLFTQKPTVGSDNLCVNRRQFVVRGIRLARSAHRVRECRASLVEVSTRAYDVLSPPGGTRVPFPVPSLRLIYDEPVSDALLDRIVVNPDVAGGKATIRGHRIWVSLVLGLLADGMTVNEVLAEYPGLEEADVRACIAYGARLASGPFVDVA